MVLGNFQKFSASKVNNDKSKSYLEDADSGCSIPKKEENKLLNLLSH